MINEMSYIDEDLDPSDPMYKILKEQSRGDIYVSRSTIERVRPRERRRRRERIISVIQTPPDLNLDVEPHPVATPPRLYTGYAEARRREYAILERPFAVVSEKLRDVGATLRKEASGKMDGQLEESKRKTRKVFTQRADATQIQKDLDIEPFKVEYVEATTPPIIAEATGLGLRAGASAFEALTMPVRPLLIAQSLATTTKLVFDPKTQTAFKEQIRADPAGFLADVGGGLVGGYTFGKIFGKVKQAYRTRKYALDAPDEAFFVKEDLIAQFPEEAAYTKTEVGLLKETETRTLATDKFRGYEDSAITKFGNIDDASLVYHTKPSGVKTPLGISFEKARIAKLRKEGWVPAGGVQQLKPLIDKAIKIHYEIPFYQKITGWGHRPGVSFRNISPTISKPFPFGAAGLGIATAFKLDQSISPSLDQTISPKIVDTPRQIQFGGRTQIQRPRVYPLIVEKPRQIQFGGYTQIFRQKIDPAITPIQRQRRRQKTITPTIQDTKKIAVPAIPQIPFGYTPPRARPPVKFRPLTKGKDRDKYLKGLFAGEFRGYKLKSPKEILRLI